MDCTEIRELITAFVDGELTPEEEALVGDHIRKCPRCQDVYGSEKRIKDYLLSMRKEVTTPSYLRQRVVESLGRKEDFNLPLWVKLKLKIRPSLIQTAALLVFFLLIVFSIAYYLGVRGEGEETIATETLKTHRRLMKGDLKVDFTTSNAEELKGFFEKTGSIPFNFTVQDMGAFGFRLRGGFIENVLGKRTAVVVYENKGHVISCYMLKASERDFPRSVFLKTTDRNRGMDFHLVRYEDYNLVIWKDKDIICVMISELDGNYLLSMAISKARLSS